MKKFLFFIFTICSFTFVQSQSADSVINRFIEANGGKERLNSINTLQVQSVMNLEQMGMSMNITSIKQKNKLFRIQSSSPMANEDSYTLITDTAGYNYTPAINSPMGSIDASLTKFSNEDLASQQHQTDCSGFFAQLVDYSTKGSTATFEGSEKVSDILCDKVKLKTKSGQEMIYFISQLNGQVRRLQVSAPVAMEMMGLSGMMKAFGGGGRMGDRKLDIDYEKYKLFNGFPFPTRQSISLGPMQVVIENSGFKVNQTIDPKWYKVK
jgi:hypothetical protein